MASPTYDLAVIGGGPAGYVAGVRAAQSGGRCVVIERDALGGTCLNWGCIPSKSLIASAALLRNIRSAADYGIEVKEARGDLNAMVEKAEKIVAGLVSGIAALFKANKVDHIAGDAVIEGKGQLRVKLKEGGEAEVRAERILIATGSRPAQIPAFPLDGKYIISSDQAVHLRELPRRLLIVGAGVIGCEFGCLYRELGAEVTMVELLDRALPLGDADVSKLIEREMKKQKIKLLTGKKILKVERKGSEMVAEVEGAEPLAADLVLVSIGRTMNTDKLGLDKIGVKLGRRGEVLADKGMRTSVPGVFAAGDCIGGLMLAHVASAEGIVAAENAMGADIEMNYRGIPAGIFTHPEVGTAGMSEEEARRDGREVRVGRFQMRALGKAQAERALAGEVKVIADARTDELLGVHVVGEHAADLVHEAALAIRHGMTAADLAEVVHAHPTLSEALMEAAEDVHGTAIHVPPKKAR
ncbi:MAG: dihydrolipoyl dehydrogenase [Candidatus Tectomicrobia bacterium]|uniref:Dihydrolipoyl dehydrogenase n=1 Tax=Tectimicrobiota bacterium TaxID=2528274 RepID=A0A932I093_UNCTE|nr:dihydrolipoyl dehydrogenase [Candidatus Tectomicrobia bacterium]